MRTFMTAILGLAFVGWNGAPARGQTDVFHYDLSDTTATIEFQFVDLLTPLTIYPRGRMNLNLPTDGNGNVAGGTGSFKHFRLSGHFDATTKITTPFQAYNYARLKGTLWMEYLNSSTGAPTVMVNHATGSGLTMTGTASPSFLIQSQVHCGHSAGSQSSGCTNPLAFTTNHSDTLASSSKTQVHLPTMAYATGLTRHQASSSGNETGSGWSSGDVKFTHDDPVLGTAVVLDVHVVGQEID